MLKENPIDDYLLNGRQRVLIINGITPYPPVYLCILGCEKGIKRETARETVNTKYCTEKLCNISSTISQF